MSGFELFAEPIAEGLANVALSLAPKLAGKAATEAKKLFSNASRKYVETYKKRHCQFKVLGMREPMTLAQLYTGVKFLDGNELLKFESTEALEKLYRQTRLRGYAGKHSDGKKRSGIDVANEKQYLMLLGGPGAGKSTFLRKVGLEALRTFHYEDAAYCHRQIPVLLELKRFEAVEIDITALITEEFKNCGFPNPLEFVQNALQQGTLLVLLDGLDEVPLTNLDNVIRVIQDFVDRYDQNRFIASCRTAAYRGGFHRFSDVGMSDFDDEQIEQFIANWFSDEQDIERETGKKCWEILQKSKNKAAKELAHTPLLLTFLCLIYDRSQRFPANRSSLYQRALRILLEEWAAEKRINRDVIYEGLSIELEEGLLSEIAYSGFEADQLFFSRRELTKQIKVFLASTLNVPKTLDGEAVLQAIEVQQGVLVERAENTYSFSHLTLQEYLTAQYLVDNNQWHEIIAHLATDNRWREVLLLIPGLLTGRQGSNDFLKALEQRANQCFQSPRLKRLVTWADKSTEGSPSDFKPGVKRISALFLALALACDRDLDLDLFRVLDQALDFACNANEQNRELDRTLVRMRDVVRARVDDLVLDPDINLELDRAKCFSQLNIFVSTNFSRLKEILDLLKSNDSSSSSSKRPYPQEIFTLWLEELKLSEEDVRLSLEEIEALTHYFYICELISQCKDASVRVSPDIWAGIEARILTVSPENTVC